MAMFVHSVVFLVLVFQPFLVYGNRNLEAEIDSLLFKLRFFIKRKSLNYKESTKKTYGNYVKSSPNVSRTKLLPRTQTITLMTKKNKIITGFGENSDNKILKKLPKTVIENRPMTRRNIGDHSERVAFYAYLSRSIADLGTNQMIAFDHVITNVGNVYNNVTGAFYCDRAGTYVFHVHLLAMPNHTVFLVLMKNTERVANIYSASTDNTYSHGGNTAVLQLYRGDSVEVRAHDHHTSDGVVIDPTWTSFSGFLLYPDDIEPAIVG